VGNVIYITYLWVPISYYYPPMGIPTRWVSNLPTGYVRSLIVSEQSAVLNQYPNQSIGANHMDMTKFSGKNDVGYQRVVNRVHDLVELMNSTQATDISQGEPLSESGQKPLQVGNLEPACSVPERRVPPNQPISNTVSGPAFAIGSQNVQGALNIST
jgi:hypothetical protein